MKKVHFKTNVLLKDILGQKLINDDNVAIHELVKNSIDAKSSKVKILFINLKNNSDDLINNRSKYIEKSSKIIIQDFGIGMSIDDLENKWLNIAYSSKKEEKKEEKNIAGEKGIGRFSCDRLGEYLDLYTKTKNDNKIHHLKIDWKDFEIQNQSELEIQKIDMSLDESIPLDKFKETTGFEPFESGTILEVSKLRNYWLYPEKNNKFNYDKLISLKTSLEKLINPSQLNKKNIEIQLKILDLDEKDFSNSKESKENYKFLNSPVENKIFQKLFFRTTSIEAEISEDGKTITTILKDKNNIIFKLIENNIFSELKDIKIVLYFLNQYSKSYFKRQTGKDSVRFGSVFLFMDGYRISPFGEFGNDWLGLEVRKGQGRARFLGTRDIIGRIERNDETNFEIVSNREGLVKNKAYSQLVGRDSDDFKNSFYYLIFRKFEKFVVDGLDWDRIHKKSNFEENADVEDIDKKETKDFIRDYEKKIFLDGWNYNPDEEIYAETQIDKNRRIAELINSIISITSKKENIISIYINEEILKNLASDNIEKTKEIIDTFSKYDSNKILDKKTSFQLKDLEKLYYQLKQQKETYYEEQQEAKKESKKETEKRIIAETERKKAKEEAETERKAKEEAEKNLNEKEKKNKFFIGLIGKDKEDIIKLQHQIGISTANIENIVLDLKERIDYSEEINNDYLKQMISDVLRENQKISSIASFITQADYNLMGESINGDLVNFIYEYLNEISKIRNSNEIKFNISKTKNKFNINFIPLDITILIDNLVSNSIKANAKNLYFDLKTEENTLLFIIEDDGRGINNEDKNKIFDFGYTTTSGSGIGLSHIKEILEENNSSIELEKTEGGVKFKIIFNK